MEKQPLVSIVIPNYNYGRYLRRCLDSAVAQTYPNIEIIIQDNYSTDDSYDIICEYEKKSRDGVIKHYINAGRNRRNVGSDRNATIAINRSEGDYIVVLSSDDALKPTFVERCVNIFQKHPTVGMVMTHRDEIDDDDKIYETIPFFDRDYVVDGESQASVFMMAGVAVPSQIMIKREDRTKTMRYRFYSFQVAGDWYSNFLMACVADVAYIKDALCEYRVHLGNETNESEKRMLGIFEHFQLINAFTTTAERIGFTKCVNRYQEAVDKLGKMCLRYSCKMLQNNEFECAKKYLYLALAFSESIKEDEKYIGLWNIINSDKDEFAEKLQAYMEQYNLNRTCSYLPPDGYIEIDEYGNSIA